MWPQRLGKIWSSIFIPAAHLDQAFGDPGGVDGVAAAGVDVGHDGNTHRLDDVPGHVQNVFHLHQADVRLAQDARGQPVAGDLDGLKAAFFDDFRAQGVVGPGTTTALRSIIAFRKTVVFFIVATPSL